MSSTMSFSWIPFTLKTKQTWPIITIACIIYFNMFVIDKKVESLSQKLKLLTKQVTNNKEEKDTKILSLIPGWVNKAKAKAEIDSKWFLYDKVT